MWTFLLCALGGDPLAEGLALVREALLRRADERELADDAVTRRLAALGAPAAPALVALVEGTGLELLLGEGEEPVLLLVPPDRVSTVALGALARLPEEAVIVALKGLLQARPGAESRAVALRILAARSSARALGLVFELLRASELELASPSLRAHARAALRAPLGRDPVAYLRVQEELQNAPLFVLLVLGEALAECASEDAVEAMEGLLGRDALLDLALIDSLAQAGTLRPWRIGAEVAGTLEALLAEGTTARRVAAASALGRLARPDSVARLVPLLESAQPELRGAALDAISACARHARFEDRETCLAWLSQENTWWRESGQARVSALASGEASPGEALRELYAHPLARSATAEALLTDLEHEDPARRALVASALGQLGVREHVPDLVPLLEDADPTVRKASAQALRKLTGVELPPERPLWDAYAFE